MSNLYHYFQLSLKAEERQEPNMIEVKEVSQVYQDNVLDRVSLTINNEIVGIVGKSGSGEVYLVASD